MRTYNKNISHYFNYLSPHEQLKEINELITYFTNHKHHHHNFRANYSKIMSLKSIKKDILSRIQNNPQITVDRAIIRLYHVNDLK